MQSWRGRILCVWRGGTSQYYAPLYDSDTDTCPPSKDIYSDLVTFKRCGSDLSAHCSESGLSCPITRMALQGPGEPTPTGFSFAEYFGDNMVLHYDNDEESKDLPIVDVTITRGPVCYEDPGDEGYGVYPLALVSKPPCTYNDSRYTVIDQIPETEYFADNDFEGVANLPRLGLSSDRNWTFSVRRSVEWLPQCAYGSFSMVDVNDHNQPIEDVTKVQIALLVAVCVICGYMLIVDPVLSCIIYTKNEEDINEFDRPLANLAVLEKLLKLLLLPFTVAAVWVTTYHHNWFNSLTSRCCSDPLTNATFNFVNFSVHDTFVMDWAMFTLSLFILLADSVFGVTVFILRTKENFR